MKKMLVALFLLPIFLPALLSAQEKYTLSGVVKDSASGETVIGATLRVPEAKAGSTTNAYGFYSITLPEGEYTLVSSYVGKKTQYTALSLHQNTKLNLSLAETALALQTVEISANQSNSQVSSTSMSTDKLSIQQIKSIPVLFGEIDVLKTLSLLPGVMAVGEGNTGFYVRGGGADQNLILLDDALIYNPSHLLGFFSIFNGDAVKDITLIKGGIPAEYGGRLASVVDVRMNEGNNKHLKVKGGIGLISSRLTIEGPLVKDKGSFLISGRRTYADLLFRQFGSESVHSSDLYFYDLNLKGNFRLGEKDQVFFSGYYGHDVLSITGVLLKWGNASGTARWNHVFNDKLFLNTSAILSNYAYDIKLSSGSNSFGIKSSILDYTYKMTFEYYPGEKNKVKFGFQETYHTFTPASVNTNGIPLLNDPGIEKKYALESGIYLSDEQQISKHLTLVYGLRFSGFDVLGPAKTFKYDSTGLITDTVRHAANTVIQEYGGLEPRLAARWMFNPATSLKASYTRTTQYVQLLTNTTASTPVDLWIPCSSVIKPQLSDQYVLGLFQNFFKDQLETSVEVYYKDMQNQIDYKPGADLALNPIVESQLYFGHGRSYGAEFFVKKKTGKLSGWIGYTLARTERQFPLINGNSWFPAKQDRRHDLSLVSIYEPNPRWTFSAVWVYATGNAVTLPTAKYTFSGHSFSYYSSRNGYRMPDYHRLDLSVTWHCRPRKKLESEWNFSVYNLYNRHNTYSIDFQKDPNNPDNTQAVRTWLFGVVPSLTYNFKF